MSKINTSEFKFIHIKTYTRMWHQRHKLLCVRWQTVTDDSLRKTKYAVKITYVNTLFTFGTKYIISYVLNNRSIFLFCGNMPYPICCSASPLLLLHRFSWKKQEAQLYCRDSGGWQSLRLWRSLKVTDFGTVYDLLLVNNINLHPLTPFSSYRSVAVQLWPVTRRFLWLMHLFSVTYANIALSHILLKTRFFGLHSYRRQCRSQQLWCKWSQSYRMQ